VSVLPASYKKHALPCDINLSAANSTNIKTYGCLTAPVVLSSLRRQFNCTFVIADVKQPILGADFFKTHELLIDVANKRLVDAVTNLTASLVRCYSDCNLTSLNADVDSALLEILSRNRDVFDIKAPRPKPTIEFTIDNAEAPPAARPYRLSPEKTDAAKLEIEKEIDLGRMTRSDSAYASPFFPVKKADGSWRFVADYTRLNKVTEKDNYIPPRIDDLLSRIPAGSVFTKIDLQKAFFLIPVAEKDRHKTAITTPFGLYQYNVMPMGLKNATQTLQRYVDTVLSGMAGVIVYCDDMLLYSARDNHLGLIDTVLQKLHNSGLVVNKQKSEFFKDSVDFLGHTLTSTEIIPSDKHLQALKNFEPPKTVKQLRRFLGMMNFYRKFLPNLSALTQPLTSLTSSKASFHWSPDAQASFEKLISMLEQVTALCYLAPNDVYTLTTDASSIALGAALHSQTGPVGFYSAMLHGAELNYCTYDKELLAVYKAVRHFEWLLLDRPFTLQVDHKPLLNMFDKVAIIERRRRQIQHLSTFQFTIVHLKGTDNVVADTLSRTLDVHATSLNFSPLQMPNADMQHLQECDTSITAIPEQHRSKDSGVWRDMRSRLLVPSSFRQDLIKAAHELCHPGAKATKAQILVSFVWPGIHKDVSTYVKNCLACQAAKVTKHTKPNYTSYGHCGNFSTLHIDFVGPLPSNKGKRYLLTIFDRNTRFFYAYPKAHPTSAAAIEALYQWISLFGVPDTIISDQGTHFESKLFQETTAALGIEKRRTTAYHPASNGAVERQHRRLKTALRTKSESVSSNWLKHLPLILLGLNNCISSDTGISPSQAVYGRLLSIPNCVFDTQTPFVASHPQRQYQRSNVHVPKDLHTSDYVWLKQESRKGSLQRPYKGPYKVIKKNFSNNTFLVDLGNGHVWINLERLKPALGIESTTATHFAKKHVTFPG